MYSMPNEVTTGIHILHALEDFPDMPSSDQVIQELRYTAKCVADSERYYGVAFFKTTSPSDAFEAIHDIRTHILEFYLHGGDQLHIFGFRPRAFVKLVIEPLLESMERLTHDELLDTFPNITEQLVDAVRMAEREKRYAPNAAYAAYKKITNDRRQCKKVQEITKQVMKLREKTVALKRDMRRSRARS